MVNARAAIETMYDDKCDIIEYQKKIDNRTNLTYFEEVLVKENIPCRISYRSLYSGVQSRMADYTKQKVKMFISPDINIKVGSKICIKQNGVLLEYKNSGQPAVYKTHQEILLELFEGWA